MKVMILIQSIYQHEANPHNPNVTRPIKTQWTRMVTNSISMTAETIDSPTISGILF